MLGLQGLDILSSYAKSKGVLQAHVNVIAAF